MIIFWTAYIGIWFFFVLPTASSYAVEHDALWVMYAQWLWFLLPAVLPRMILLALAPFAAMATKASCPPCQDPDALYFTDQTDSWCPNHTWRAERIEHMEKELLDA